MPRRSRSTEVSRIIHASRRKIYRAFLDPAALVKWLPPGTMTGRMHAFSEGEGGGYRMSLSYTETDNRPPGKTSADTDTFRVRFVELVPSTRIVQAVAFESSDAALSDEMVMTISLADSGEGTLVRILHENIPRVVRLEDNETGTRQSLDQLEAFVVAH